MADHRFAIGLGSNIEDRKAYLDQALAFISELPETDVLATSPVYASAGWGREDLAPFLNAVIALKSSLAPRRLLDEMLAIEEKLGRRRTEKWAARTIDLDIIAWDGEPIREEKLKIPHPWMNERPFVYTPLRDVLQVCPEWEDLIQPTDQARVIEKDTLRRNSAGPAWGSHAEPAAAVSLETNSEEETMNIAGEASRYIHAGTTIALKAPMGAGKSVFARGLARGLGVTGRVQSPTFTLCRLYDVARGVFEHWDFYRLESEDDLYTAGFFEGGGEERIRAVEWADYFPRALEGTVVWTTIEPLSAERRRITFERAGGVPFPLRAIARNRGPA